MTKPRWTKYPSFLTTNMKCSHSLAFKSFVKADNCEHQHNIHTSSSNRWNVEETKVNAASICAGWLTYALNCMSRFPRGLNQYTWGNTLFCFWLYLSFYNTMIRTKTWIQSPSDMSDFSPSQSNAKHPSALATCFHWNNSIPSILGQTQ